jgi:hypothetical protein
MTDATSGALAPIKRFKPKKRKPSKYVEELQARFRAIDFDPVDVAVELIRCSVEMSDMEKASICMKLAEFVYPKRKALEIVPASKDIPMEIEYVADWGNRAEVSDEHDST